MRAFSLSALGASSLLTAATMLAIGVALTVPASAASADQVAGRAQSILVAAESEGAGIDTRTTGPNARWVAMVAPEQMMLAGRPGSLLVAEAEGSGIDVRANARWVA